MTETYPCRACKEGKLIYQISWDAYVCTACKRHFDVLSIEESHIAYTGGPPVEIDYR